MSKKEAPCAGCAGTAPAAFSCASCLQGSGGESCTDFKRYQYSESTCDPGRMHPDHLPLHPNSSIGAPILKSSPSSLSSKKIKEAVCGTAPAVPSASCPDSRHGTSPIKPICLQENACQSSESTDPGVPIHPEHLILIWRFLWCVGAPIPSPSTLITLAAYLYEAAQSSAPADDQASSVCPCFITAYTKTILGSTTLDRCWSHASRCSTTKPIFLGSTIPHYYCRAPEDGAGSTRPDYCREAAGGDQFSAQYPDGPCYVCVVHIQPKQDGARFVWPLMRAAFWQERHIFGRMALINIVQQMMETLSHSPARLRFFSHPLTDASDDQNEGSQLCGVFPNDLMFDVLASFSLPLLTRLSVLSKAWNSVIHSETLWDTVLSSARLGTSRDVLVVARIHLRKAPVKRIWYSHHVPSWAREFPWVRNTRAPNELIAYCARAKDWFPLPISNHHLILQSLPLVDTPRRVQVLSMATYGGLICCALAIPQLHSRSQQLNRIPTERQRQHVLVYNCFTGASKCLPPAPDPYVRAFVIVRMFGTGCCGSSSSAAAYNIVLTDCYECCVELSRAL